MTIEVPTGLHEVSLRQYQQLCNLDTQEGSDSWISEAICILCNVSPSIVHRMTMSEVSQVAEVIKEWTDVEKSEYPLVHMFEQDGVTYGFHPNLSKLTVGEFADLDTYCQEGWDEMDRVMSILYRPVTFEQSGVYEIGPYYGSRTWPDIPMHVVLGAVAFFLRTEVVLASDTHSYSQVLRDRKRPRWWQSGGGMSRFIGWLRGTS